MARSKRTFATIERLPSKRWQVHYTDPTGASATRRTPSPTRIDAEAYVVALRRRIDRDQWNATDEDPKEQITFGAYAARWLANRQVAGRPLKARTREHYQAILDAHLVPAFGSAAARRDQAQGRPRVVRGDAGRPADTAIARLLAAAHDLDVARSTRRCIDANPARIVGAGRAKRVHRIRPASVAELGVLTEAMPERLRLMVTLASWCALRFGEIVELRRGDIDLGAGGDPDPARGGAHEGRVLDHHTEV